VSNCEASLNYALPDLRLFAGSLQSLEESITINSEKLSIEPYDLETGMQVF